LQSFSSVAEPTQPSWPICPFKHVRDLAIFPFPQLLEQAPVGLHSPQDGQVLVLQV